MYFLSTISVEQREVSCTPWTYRRQHIKGYGLDEMKTQKRHICKLGDWQFSLWYVDGTYQRVGFYEPCLRETSDFILKISEWKDHSDLSSQQGYQFLYQHRARWVGMLICLGRTRLMSDKRHEVFPLLPIYESVTFLGGKTEGYLTFRNKIFQR